MRVRLKSKDSGRKRKELSEDERSWLLEFLDRSDISYTTPGRKDNQYIGKVIGEKQYVQKRYLLWTLRDVLTIANGGSINTNGTFSDEFSRTIPLSSCLCEICENICFLAKGISKKLPEES